MSEQSRCRTNLKCILEIDFYTEFFMELELIMLVINNPDYRLQFHIIFMTRQRRRNIFKVMLEGVKFSFLNRFHIQTTNLKSMNTHQYSSVSYCTELLSG